jgi:protoporphyrinogen oxidase
MAKIVIIGAGLTGLSTAYHLEKKGFFDYQMFEKESTIGGLCRSVYQDGFTFDFTGHLLHTNDAYFRSLIEQTVGLEHLHVVNRRSFIYSQETYTRYPYQVNLHGLPIDTIIECIEGYVTRPKQKKMPHNFVQWVQQQFGRGFARHFFLPYQQKIFAFDVRKLTASWTNRFVPSTSLAQILRGTLLDTHDEAVGYNSQFLYPKEGGIISWVQRFASSIQNPIRTNFCVKTIDMRTKTITFTNGHREPFDQLISTMPLDLLLNTLTEKTDSFLRDAQPHLRCNKVLNFNLGINRDDVSDKHWIYFPEKQYPFYRLGFPHNFASTSVPKGHSSLYGEFSYMHKPTAWITKTIKEAIAATKHVLKIDTAQIVTECIIPISHAYVIYDQWRDLNLPKLLAALTKQQVYSIGRYGEWKYSSMQEAVLDGKKIAETLTVLPAYKTSDIKIQQSTSTSKEKMHAPNR